MGAPRGGVRIHQLNLIPKESPVEILDRIADLDSSDLPGCICYGCGELVPTRPNGGICGLPTSVVALCDAQASSNVAPFRRSTGRLERRRRTARFSAASAARSPIPAAPRSGRAAEGLRRGTPACRAGEGRGLAGERRVVAGAPPFPNSYRPADDSLLASFNRQRRLHAWHVQGSHAPCSDFAIGPPISLWKRGAQA
jgi:hypothetical protein